MAGIGNIEADMESMSIVRERRYIDEGPGDMSVQNLPVKAPRRNAQNLTHVVDIVPHVRLVYDWEDVKVHIANSDYENLPGPLSTKGPGDKAVDVQLVIVPEGDGLVTVVKHLIMKDRVNHGEISAVAHGAWKCLDYAAGVAGDTQMVDDGTYNRGKHSTALKKFQATLEKLPGQQALLFKLQPVMAKSRGKNRNEVELTPEQVDAGYDYIEMYGPRSQAKNAFGRFIKKHMTNNSPTNPLAGFTRLEILDALKNRRQQGEHASVQQNYPLTLQDVAKWFRPLLVDLLPRMNVASLILLGEKKQGKTALASILASAYSAFQVKKNGLQDTKAQFRLTQNLDFLKDAEGEPWIPFIFDDGDLKDWSPKVMKAFLDQKASESMSWARWGGSKYKGGQLRIICDNPYDNQVDLSKYINGSFVSLPMFYRLIAPAFPKKMDMANLEAVLPSAQFSKERRARETE